MLKLRNCYVNLLHSVLSSQKTKVLDSLQNTFALYSACLKKAAWLFHSPWLTRDTVLSQWKWESVLHCASPRKDQRIWKEQGLSSALFNWWAHVSVSWTMFTIEQRDTRAAHARHMWGMKLGCDKRTGHSSFKKTLWALILHNELGQAYLIESHLAHLPVEQTYFALHSCFIVESDSYALCRACSSSSCAKLISCLDISGMHKCC